MSLNELLPIELPSGSEWKPSNEYIHIRDEATPVPVTYATFSTIERLSGWILVPTGPLAFGGLLYRHPSA